MVKITLTELDNFSSALRKFRRKCAYAGIINKSRRKMFYEKPAVKRRKAGIIARQILKLKAKKMRIKYKRY